MFPAPLLPVALAAAELLVLLAVATAPLSLVVVAVEPPLVEDPLVTAAVPEDTAIEIGVEVAEE